MDQFGSRMALPRVTRRPSSERLPSPRSESTQATHAREPQFKRMQFTLACTTTLNVFGLCTMTRQPLVSSFTDCTIVTGKVADTPPPLEMYAGDEAEQ